MNFSIQTLHILKVGVVLGVLLSFPMASLGMTNAITTPPPVSGHELSIQSITPADVFARVQLVRKELDDIRFEMGKPKSREIGLLVEDATPHEVFFQAKTLNQKVALLITELTEESAAPWNRRGPGRNTSFSCLENDRYFSAPHPVS